MSIRASLVEREDDFYSVAEERVARKDQQERQNNAYLVNHLPCCSQFWHAKSRRHKAQGAATKPMGRLPRKKELSLCCICNHVRWCE